MKSGMLIVAVLASVIAGAGGGYVAATYGAPEKGSNKVAVETAPLEMGADDTVSSRDHTSEITELRNDLQNIQVRMQGMVSVDEHDALNKKYEALNKRLEELKAGGVVVANSGDGVDLDAIPPEVLESALDEALDKREAAKEAERQAEREAQMAEWTKRRNDAIVETLATQLSLTEVQKVNIGVALENYATKRRDVWVRSGAAREAGEEFDFRGEMSKVHESAAEEVRAELSTAQLTTFNELLGDRDLENLGGRRGGFGGGRGRGN